MTTEPKSLVYTVDQVARKLKLSRNLTYRLCREKKLPGSIHLGAKRMVFSAAAIDALLAGEDVDDGKTT